MQNRIHIEPEGINWLVVYASLVLIYFLPAFPMWVRVPIVICFSINILAAVKSID